MTRFENATPRPWVIRTSRDTSGDNGITADGLPNVLAETFADIRFRGERNAAEARANAELIVTAVNAHEALCNSVEAALRMVDGDGHPPDWDEMRAALKLARQRHDPHQLRLRLP